VSSGVVSKNGQGLAAGRATAPTTKDGAYVWKESSFRQHVSSAPGARFAPEPGRYHLYVNHSCPWAHRALIVRAVKGLRHVIGATFLDHRLPDAQGWVFSPQEPDPLYAASRLRELYLMAAPDFEGRVTIPVLWDKRERTIVNNESAEIVRMLGSAFDAFAEHADVDLYPEPLRPTIDRWNERIQVAVNAGVYRAGFATSQAAYDEAVTAFFAALDELELHLGSHRYLVGAQPTEADWRLFPTLLRFEWVYHGLFKCDLRRLIDYPHLYAYTRELYQWPGIAADIDVRRLREGYYASMHWANASGIVSIGPLVDFNIPHGRHALPRRAGDSATG
jgi:glutathionyl-hydroquinone reductase